MPKLYYRSKIRESNDILLIRIEFPTAKFRSLDDAFDRIIIGATATTSSTIVFVTIITIIVTIVDIIIVVVIIAVGRLIRRHEWTHVEYLRERDVVEDFFMDSIRLLKPLIRKKKRGRILLI